MSNQNQYDEILNDDIYDKKNVENQTTSSPRKNLLLNNKEQMSFMTKQKNLEKQQLENLQNQLNSNVLKVDPRSNQIKSISEAIGLSKNDQVISIQPGLYKENLYINKPGLRLQPSEKNGLDVIILVQKGSGIVIDLEKDQKCYINGIKIMHIGNTENEEFNLINPNYQFKGFTNQDTEYLVNPDFSCKMSDIQFQYQQIQYLQSQC
ncbi:Pectin lyase fold/virulence factor [Pseudocohnilembus persalinus]|uniref:Pectin lyase fold/virulence factor n=1 Tax=Pseudocohnilembus persalinus TaxID=266149 RepID=A0A0V0QV02_PSEPJ|nr:Pectin lyase fold/virulence factor [Pseudocohnilembus persalinus]|eukprot:KRX06052.1 Pectin lyase fold/virulence factor [Pseudocohnilembus persalinus]